jgi:hypothetical protein
MLVARRVEAGICADVVKCGVEGKKSGQRHRGSGAARAVTRDPDRVSGVPKPSWNRSAIARAPGGCAARRHLASVSRGDFSHESATCDGFVPSRFPSSPSWGSRGLTSRRRKWAFVRALTGVESAMRVTDTPSPPGMESYPAPFERAAPPPCFAGVSKPPPARESASIRVRRARDSVWCARGREGEERFRPFREKSPGRLPGSRI